MCVLQVIFLIAGCKLGSLMVDADFRNLWELSHTRLMIILIYPIILFARGTAIAICFPLLKRLGTGCSWKEAIVMWHGGLRGSVGLALGLIVHHLLYDKAFWGDGSSTTWGTTYVSRHFQRTYARRVVGHATQPPCGLSHRACSDAHSLSRLPAPSVFTPPP
jgi:hypothetical protein